MKLSKKDIDDFIKDGKEKPVTYKDNKLYVPTHKGHEVKKLDSDGKAKKQKSK